MWHNEITFTIYSVCVFLLGWCVGHYRRSREVKRLTKELQTSGDALQNAVNKNK